MLASNMCKIIAQSSGGDGRKCQRQNGHFIEVEEIQNTITTETLESVARLLPVYVVVRSLNCCFSQKKKVPCCLSPNNLQVQVCFSPRTNIASE